MRTNRLFILGAVLLFAVNDFAEGQTTNSWKSVGAGNWQTSSDWSLARIPTNTDSVFFTNAITKAIFINSGTTNTASMTITNFTLSAPAGATNEVQLTNPGTNVPFRILNAFTITAGGSLLISDAVVRVEGLTATPFKDDGNVVLVSSSSRLIMTNAVLNSVGQSARGSLTLSNGTVMAQSLLVGNGSGAKGTLTMAGGLCQLSGSLTVGSSAGATGTVWVTGGRLLLSSPSDLSRIGFTGVGLMVVSNGSVEAINLVVGTSARGTLALRGGTNIVSSSFTVAGGAGTGEVFITGGQLLTTNVGQSTLIGANVGVGQVTMSDGTWLARRTVLGSLSGSQGTLAIAGGTNVLLSSLSIGEDTNATGLVTLGGTGRLVVTNAPTFIGARGIGQMTISGGVFLASSVLLGTNATATGTLTVNGGTGALSGPLTVGVAGTSIVSVLSGQLVITNTPATVGAGSGFIVDGSVTLTNGGSILVQNVRTVIGNNGSGSLTVSGGSLLVTNLVIGSNTTSSGTITFRGGAGTFLGTSTIGQSGKGQVIVNNGSLITSSYLIALNAGSAGTLTIVNGSNTVLTSFTVGNAAGSTGAVWVTGSTGLLDLANAVSQVGGSGDGALTISNGTCLLANPTFGAAGGGRGVLTALGGKLSVNNGNSVLGNIASSTGSVWLVGGQITWTNVALTVGNNGSGELAVSNAATIVCTNLTIGALGNSRGTFTMAAGTCLSRTNIILGNFSCSAIGVMNVAGGSVTGGAMLEVRSGTLTVSAGALTAKTLVITNSCGRFIHTAGTAFFTTTNITANLDADGDGLPNSWETSFGFSPFNDTGNDGANGDPDGDGFTNLQEFNAGTLPTVAGSMPTYNSWNVSPSGFWDQGANWLLGTPPSTNVPSIFITNAVSKTVTIPATTLAVNLVVSNLTIAAPSGAVNTLAVTNLSTPLLVLRDLTCNAGGDLLVSNAMVQVTGTTFITFPTIDGTARLRNGGLLYATNLYVGALSGSSGTLTVDGGTNVCSDSLIIGYNGGATGTVWLASGLVSNLTTFIGSSGAAQMTVSNGTLISSNAYVGYVSGSRGTLTVAGGNCVFDSIASQLVVGDNPNSTGTVWVTSGNLKATGALIGSFATGQMTISNGLFDIGYLYVSGASASAGTFTVAGGTTLLSDSCLLGNSGATGTVWMTGGEVVATNVSTFVRVGYNGIGRMTMSNGTCRTLTLTIGGPFAGSAGTLTINGGTVTAAGMTLGTIDCSATGTVILAGGSLFVTNATTNATLEVRSGTATINSGTLTVNRIVATNACAVFITTGGTVVYTTAILNPSADADGDGMNNGFEQTYGLNPFDPADAGGDPDGDGLTNLQEFQLGSNPVADIKAITKEGIDIRVTWQAAPGKTNALQRSPGSNGSYSNNFADIFIVTNNVGSVTNYPDVGAATNFPSRYYRVRLVP